MVHYSSLLNSTKILNVFPNYDIQDLNEEVNIIQGKNKDEACEQINSIEVKENEATAIQTNQESDFSTIFIEQSKCEEPHIEEHNDNENVDDTYTEKEEHNTCFEHEDQGKEHDSSNQVSYMHIIINRMISITHVDQLKLINYYAICKVIKILKLQ